MAVGFWDFAGAGIFGFLIDMPVESTFEASAFPAACGGVSERIQKTTPFRAVEDFPPLAAGRFNHGHAALRGAFGMLAMALPVFGLRHVPTRSGRCRRSSSRSPSGG